MSANVHGTAVALSVDADGPLIGVILLGESGAGKTSSAFQLITQCPYQRSRLIADDHVIITHGDGDLLASPIMGFGGLAEVRHAGLVRMAFADKVPLRYALRSGPKERLGPQGKFSPLGTEAPTIPEIAVPGFSSTRVLIRSLLSGHSLTGGMD